MRIVIYGKQFKEDADSYIRLLYKKLVSKGIETVTYSKFADFLKSRAIPDFDFDIYNSPSELKVDFDILITIGGDGTILDTITSVGGSNIPILGINTGRLGFLANNAKENVEHVIDLLLKGEYFLEKRSLLSLKTEDNLFEQYNFAMNEITIHKKDSSSMIQLHTYVDDLFLNTYWSDGLIISTPTGSTAYSLSCGGPILDPKSKNFIINPIAPHNLTARPIIIPDDSKIRIEVEGRDEEFLVTLDSRSKTITNKYQLNISKADFTINLVQFGNQNFYKTIRNKLYWGQDKRN